MTIQGKTIRLIAIILLLSTAAMSQRKIRMADSVPIYQEFSRLGHWYQQIPLQMNLHFVQKTIPAIGKQDSTETDMILYYGKNNFYMQAEGLEQIANDSVLVLVNSEAKMIKLYPNNGIMQKNLQNSAMMFMPDSTFHILVARYAANMQEEGSNRKRITLQSREKVFGTDLPKEVISVSYQSESLQPVTFEQSKRTLVPIDASVYNRLLQDQAYNGKLVSTKVKDDLLYFFVKEQQTSCRFININHDLQAPPVKQEDRVTKLNDGTFQPAKEFTNYLLSKEF